MSPCPDVQLFFEAGEGVQQIQMAWGFKMFKIHTARADAPPRMGISMDFDCLVKDRKNRGGFFLVGFFPSRLVFVDFCSFASLLFCFFASPLFRSSALLLFHVCFGFSSLNTVNPKKHIEKLRL
jgi:hypothetical protein